FGSGRIRTASRHGSLSVPPPKTELPHHLTPNNEEDEETGFYQGFKPSPDDLLNPLIQTPQRLQWRWKWIPFRESATVHALRLSRKPFPQLQRQPSLSSSGTLGRRTGQRKFYIKSNGS
ncbi:Uncharacterized protein FKW44_015128, partial [Caligus rogercresseyi]